MNGLQEQGVHKGTKVALLLPNCPQYIISYYAILKIGGIVVNFNPLYSTGELIAHANNVDVDVLITLNLKIMYEKIDALLEKTSINKVIIGDFRKYLKFPVNLLFSIFKCTDLSKVQYDEEKVHWNKLFGNDGKYTKVVINPQDDVAVLQFTGGTTGDSKAAQLTHHNINANRLQTASLLGNMEDGKETILAVLPFFHIFAMTAIMNFGFTFGAKLLIHPRFVMKNFLKDLRKKKPTLIALVPAIYVALNNNPKLKKEWFDSLKTIISGGASLPQAVNEKFYAKTGKRIQEGYGLTESSPVISLTPCCYSDKVGTVGLPVPASIVEVVSLENDNEVLPIGETGEICVTGPQVMKGYIAKSSSIENPIKNGRLHTGDVGYLDATGFLYIIDRIKEMIISNGMNIYPCNVEKAIIKNDDVDEVAVIGIPDEQRGELVRAYIVKRKGSDLNKEKLLAFLQDQLAKYSMPKQIKFIDELPKTMIGKIDKKELKKQEGQI
jgi:long-chain acyl-CoA synthetase